MARYDLTVRRCEYDEARLQSYGGPDDGRACSRLGEAATERRAIERQLRARPRWGGGLPGSETRSVESTLIAASRPWS